LIHLPVDAATDDAVIEAFLGDLRKVTAVAHGGTDAARADLRY